MKIDNGGMSDAMRNLATGKRINSAADDAAGLSIANKMESVTKGHEQAIRNTEDMQSLTNVAEGALSSIQDSLQRIRELGVQASNATLSGSDKASIQTEIDALKESIQTSAQNTEFNSIKILDGTFTNKNLASNPSGTGQQISIQNTSLATLGIDTFDVTSSFDLSDIDNAIEKVSESRANLGSLSNTMDHQISYNKLAAYNVTASQSRVQDSDIAKELTELKKQQVIQQYQVSMQKMQMDNYKNKFDILGG